MNQPPELAITKTYSLTLTHIGRVSNMAMRTGLSQGEIIRRAIDLLWAQMEYDERQSETAGQQPNPDLNECK